MEQRFTDEMVDEDFGDNNAGDFITRYQTNLYSVEEHFETRALLQLCIRSLNNQRRVVEFAGMYIPIMLFFEEKVEYRLPITQNVDRIQIWRDKLREYLQFTFDTLGGPELLPS